MEDTDCKFVHPLPEKLVCNICAGVLREPQLTGCCGQHYCLDCLHAWFKRHKQKSCPQCRTRGFSHVPDKSIQRDINQLEVFCSHRSEGCRWTGERGDLRKHLSARNGCDYECVGCPNRCPAGEGFRLKRKDVASHLRKECVLRKHKCRNCGQEDTYQNITSPLHADCFARDCPNGCGEKGIKSKNMQSHRKMCPLQKVRCPNGCSDLPRCLLRDHTQYHCPFRNHTCEHCGYEGTYENVTTVHLLVCPRQDIRCPNRCGAVFRRYQVNSVLNHRVLECPRQLFRCPLCSGNYTRTELDQVHLRTHGFQYFLWIVMLVTANLPQSSRFRRMLDFYVWYALQVYKMEGCCKFCLSCLIGATLWFVGFGYITCFIGILLALAVFYGYLLLYLYYRGIYRRAGVW